MRFFLALLLMFTIPFNAAFAAASGVCDVMEGQAQHALHLGHHAHAHDHTHAEASNTANTDSGQSGTDHNHSHAHPLFSWMLPAPLGINPPLATGAAASHPAERFVSATPPRLERPPRAHPVA